ncbi:MAG: prepilin-type N-terminal cleavage/methylation domain-containing protein [Verrucomicrobiae bacterium]|nr:prepilin-type N-terminal cleavage/methylation domain-containing protein [Verrucomicrobiae bacterium]
MSAPGLRFPGKEGMFVVCVKNNSISGGFTLLELLVVVAIMSILAGLLMPAVGKAREQGRSIRCMNNLKNMGEAMHLYLNDNNEMFFQQGAYPDHYTKFLGPYLNVNKIDGVNWVACSSIYRCPTYKGTDSDYFTYGYNSFCGYVSAAQPYRSLAGIDQPARFPLFLETDANQNLTSVSTSYDTLSFRHLGNMNVVCVGGNVKVLPVSQMPLSSWTYKFLNGEVEW